MATRFKVFLERQTVKTIPVLADKLPLADSADNDEIKQVSLTDLATLINAGSTSSDDAIIFAIALG